MEKIEIVSLYPNSKPRQRLKIARRASFKRKTRKRSKRTISSYKKELDAIFSKFIRARDKHTCYTCGRVMESNKSQNGHFIPRQYLATRWDERNNHAQDYSCNVLYNGQPSVYALKLIEEYGAGIIEELESMRKISLKLDEAFYLAKIEEYKEKVDNLLRETGQVLG